MLRRILRLSAGLLVLGLAAAFAYGPLFPWSPWKPGFSHLELARADVYYADGYALPAAYRDLDRYIGEAERFHHYTMDKRVTVVVCDKWGEFERMVPYVRGRGIGAVTLATGTVIFVTPILDAKKYDHGEFLRHELSHAVLHQHQSLRAAIASANTWMFEGMAVSFGRQSSYHSRDDLVVWARAHELEPLFDPARRDSTFSIRMAYPAWRFFNEYLKTSRGEQAHSRFLAVCMKDPSEWRPAFAASFGEDFSNVLEYFRRHLTTARL